MITTFATDSIEAARKRLLQIQMNLIAMKVAAGTSTDKENEWLDKLSAEEMAQFQQSLAAAKRVQYTQEKIDEVERGLASFLWTALI
jgi:hypothetical protein